MISRQFRWVKFFNQSYVERTVAFYHKSILPSKKINFFVLRSLLKVESSKKLEKLKNSWTISFIMKLTSKWNGFFPVIQVLKKLWLRFFFLTRLSASLLSCYLNYLNISCIFYWQHRPNRGHYVISATSIFWINPFFYIFTYVVPRCIM